MQETQGLRKKHDGPGIMVSAFQSEVDGFGLRLTKEEMDDLNCRRAMDEEPKLKYTPGLTFLNYGKNKDGYWDFKQFRKQARTLPILTCPACYCY